MSIFVAGSGEFEASPPPPHVLVPLRNEFSLSGETYGVELLAEYEPADWWRLTAGYTWLHMRMEDSVDDDNPEHQFSFRSYVDLTQDLELNGALYYVDQTFHSTAIVPIATPSYVRLDLGLAWRPYDWMELAVWGQNLLDDRHAEFFSFHTTYATEIPRGVFGKLSVRF
jgi:iron complex outermembrane receptor protein